MSLKFKITVVGGTIIGLALFTWGLTFLGNKYFPREESVTVNEASVVAESWIKNFSSSYPLYGKDLQLVEERGRGRGEYEFVFEFVTENPEYGKRKNEMFIQTKETEVVTAITNEVFNEMSREYIEKEATVLVYLVTKEDGEEEEVVSVERVVTESEKNEEDVLMELLSGPTEEEMQAGYDTSIGGNIELYSFDIEGRTAYIELSVGLNELSTLAREQIENTVMQFNTIDTVEEPKRKEVVKLELEGIPEGFIFERDMKEGDKGEDVKYLQIMLNADPDTKIAERGPGSPGEETEYLGPATVKALMSFQRKYADEVLEPAGLTLATGVVDEHTRDKLNAILEASGW